MLHIGIMYSDPLIKKGKDGAPLPTGDPVDFEVNI